MPTCVIACSVEWNTTMVEVAAATKRAVIMEDANEQLVATVLEDFSMISSHAEARAAVTELLQRGRDVGLIHCHDHRQRTSDGLIYRMYGQWCKPDDEHFLDALAEGLFEFGFVAYTVELMTK